jgi:large subunit ribosomal protein L15
VKLSDVLSKTGKKRNRKRRGRGPGSGLGKTSGRGHKGAASRSGYRRRLSFEGGQVSLIRHLPKRGFTNAPFRRRFDVVNLAALEKHFDGGASVGLDVLAQRKILKPQHGRLKILGTGSLTKSLKVVAHAVSQAAREKIEAAGGSVELVGPQPKPGKSKGKRANAPKNGK